MDKLKGTFSKLNDLCKEGKYEVLLYWKNEKDDIINFFRCLGFGIFMLGVCFHIRIFLTIFLTFISAIIIFGIEVKLDNNTYTQYPLLRKIKHGLIRSIVYPIALLLNGFLWYALLFY